MDEDAPHATVYRSLAVRPGDEPEPRLACPWCGRRAMSRRVKAHVHPDNAVACAHCGRRVSIPAYVHLLLVPSFVAAGVSALLLERSGALTWLEVPHDDHVALLAVAVMLCLACGHGAVMLVERRMRLIRRASGTGKAQKVVETGLRRYASDDLNRNAPLPPVTVMVDPTPPSLPAPRLVGRSHYMRPPPTAPPVRCPDELSWDATTASSPCVRRTPASGSARAAVLALWNVTRTKASAVRDGKL